MERVSARSFVNGHGGSADMPFVTFSADSIIFCATTTSMPFRSGDSDMAVAALFATTSGKSASHCRACVRRS